MRYCPAGIRGLRGRRYAGGVHRRARCGGVSLLPSEARARRFADRINEELAALLQRKAADPGLEGLTVTGVEVDREFAYATVFVAGGKDEEAALAALRRARGFLRSQLASRISIRTFPQLRFRWDHSSARGARIDELLDQLKQEGGDESAG